MTEFVKLLFLIPLMAQANLLRLIATSSNPGPAGLFGCTWWVDFADTSTITTGGGTGAYGHMLAVKDKSVSALNGIAADPNQPGWSDDIPINSKPTGNFAYVASTWYTVVDFGTNKIINSGKPFTVYIVAQIGQYGSSPYPTLVNLVNDGGYVLSIGPSPFAGFGDFYFGSDSSHGSPLFYNGKTGSVGLTVGTPFSIVLTYSGSSPESASSYQFLYNWSAATIVANGGNTTSSYNHNGIGIDRIDATTFVGFTQVFGGIGEVAVFAKVLSPAEISTLQSYSMSKWGV